MFQNFFTFESGLPNIDQWNLFGPQHLAVLLILAGTAWIGGGCYRKLDRERQHKADCGMGAAFLALEAVKYSYLLGGGHFSPGELPLHLCGLAVYLEAFHAFFQNKLLGQVIYSLCLPGAALGLLFPDWTCYPMLSYMNLHGFYLHGLLVFYAMCQIRAGRIVPRLSYVPSVTLFLGVLVVPVYCWNLVFSTNYMFLRRPSPGSPLVALEQWFGNPGYLLPYGFLIFLLILGMNVWYERYRVYDRTYFGKEGVIKNLKKRWGRLLSKNGWNR